MVGQFICVYIRANILLGLHRQFPQSLPLDKIEEMHTPTEVLALMDTLKVRLSIRQEGNIA